MATNIVSAGGRRRRVSAQDNGVILDFGPASTPQMVGTWFFQFMPSSDFQGAFAVLGRAFGYVAVQGANAPFIQVPYRRINLNGVASDYALVADLVTGTGIIMVGSSGMDVGMLVGCTAGECDILSWDIAGPISY